MSMENAKRFLESLQRDEALRERVAEEDFPAVAAIANELGFELTAEELQQVAREYRQKPGEMSPDLAMEEMDKVAGGMWWESENGSDGHEMGCAISYHHYKWSKEHDEWCKSSHFCKNPPQNMPEWTE